LSLRASRLGCSLTLLLCSSAAFTDQALIAHPSVNTRVLSLNTSRLIFSMQLRQWSDGAPVRVFVLPDDSRLHGAFARDLLSLYPRQLRRVWDRQLYSGTGQAPETVANELEMRQRVASTPGAIGYLSSEMIDDTVNVVCIRTQ
jgi:ABC-type phosphate transport system substrate-binding protein